MTMRYSDQELRTRLRLGEDAGWEFKLVEFRGEKPSASQRETWADEMVAFANTNGGVLLLGVNDDGSVQGMSRAQLDAVERMISELCRDAISPEIRPQIYRVELDGRALMFVEIPAGYAQHEHAGKSYERVGSSKRLMTSDDRLRLAQRRGQARFRGFDQQPVPGTGFGTLSERLWKPLLSAENLSSPDTGLQKLGLLTTDEHGQLRASIAGVLLCSEEPHEILPQAAVTAVAYRGTDQSSGQLDARTIEGPLDKLIRDGIAFVIRNMQVGAHKDPGRVDLPEYSIRATFEALVNAVVHRDYSLRGSRVRIRMFSDRMEICSPGSLPNGMTIERMGDVQSTRNEVLASMLSRMRVSGTDGSGDRQFYMDRRGDGVLIIRQETLALTGKLPEYELIDNVELRLTLPAAEPQSSPAIVVVTVRTEGVPHRGATVLALFPNNTWKSAATDEHGEARLDLHSVNLPMTVFVAGTGVAGHVEHDWLPSQRPLAVELSPMPSGGSVIFAESTGDIPGLFGRLNPILDTLQRTYLYASNIAINGGEPQPVTFLPETEELHLTDADGHERLIRILAIRGRTSVLDYRTVESA